MKTQYQERLDAILNDEWRDLRIDLLKNTELNKSVFTPDQLKKREDLIFTFTNIHQAAHQLMAN